MIPNNILFNAYHPQDSFNSRLGIFSHKQAEPSPLHPLKRKAFEHCASRFMLDSTLKYFGSIFSCTLPRCRFYRVGCCLHQRKRAFGHARPISYQNNKRQKHLRILDQIQHKTILRKTKN